MRPKPTIENELIEQLYIFRVGNRSRINQLSQFSVISRLSVIESASAYLGTEPIIGASLGVIAAAFTVELYHVGYAHSLSFELLF